MSVIFGKYLKVTFVGEPAADEGGILQEFLHLLMAQNGKSFCGEGNNVLPDRDRMFELIASHFAAICVKAELDQLVLGLKTSDVLDLIRSNPAKVRILLVRKNPVRLNADIMVDLLLPAFSLEGSNQWEAVMILRANFIQLVK